MKYPDTVQKAEQQLSKVRAASIKARGVIPPISLYEQVAAQKQLMKNYENEEAQRIATAILSSLLELQRIRAAERPEPVAWIWNYSHGPKALRWRAEYNPISTDVPSSTTPLYGPEVLAYADRMRAERDALKRTLDKVTRS